MSTPVCSRFATYDVKLDPAAAAYRDLMLRFPAMLEWTAAAKAEPEEVEELDEAEKPERPRLMTPAQSLLTELAARGETWTHVPSGVSGEVSICAIERDRAAAVILVRELPRYRSTTPLGADGLITEPLDNGVECVALADVLSLLEGK